MKKETTNRIIVLFIVFYCFTMFLSYNACEDTNLLNIDLVSKNYNIKRGEDFSLTLVLFSKEEISLLSSLKIITNFDTSKLTFKKATLKNKNSGTRIKTTHSSGTINLNYTNQNGLNLDSQSQTELLELEFHTKVRIDHGSTEITSELGGIYDKNNNSINANLNPQPVSLNILTPDTSTCLLNSLSTSDGIIKPQFNSNIYNYEVDVSYNIKDIYVYFSAANPDATIKVNRHKLLSAGKSTDINVTICDKNEKSKLIYTVTVNRKAKPIKNKKSKSKKSLSTKANNTPYTNSKNNSCSTKDKSNSKLAIDESEPGKTEEIDKPNEEQQIKIPGSSDPQDICVPKDTIHIESPSKYNDINKKLLVLCFIITIISFLYSSYIILNSIKSIFSDSKINRKHNIYLD